MPPEGREQHTGNVPVLFPLPTAEIDRIVDVGEGLTRGDRDPKQRAQRLPAFLDVEDEEPLGRNRRDDIAVVLLEDADGRVAVLEFPGRVPSQTASCTVWNPCPRGD